MMEVEIPTETLVQYVYRTVNERVSYTGIVYTATTKIILHINVLRILYILHLCILPT
jgi:hypothetical protein